MTHYQSIEAVGSISDHLTAIELLITDDSDIALEGAIQCEEVNQKCEVLSEKIECEAVAWIKESQREHVTFALSRSAQENCISSPLKQEGGR